MSKYFFSDYIDQLVYVVIKKHNINKPINIIGVYESQSMAELECSKRKNCYMIASNLYKMHKEPFEPLYINPILNFNNEFNNLDKNSMDID